MDLFSINGKFFHFMYQVADLMILSVLWLLCSLPLFTIGASTPALYYCIIKVIREEGSEPIKTFFRAFRDNFRMGSNVIGLVFLACLLISLMGTTVYRIAGSAVLTNVYVVYLVFGGVAIALLHYVFSYIARFDAPLKTILKNSFVIFLANLPMSISMTVLFLVVWGGFALLLPRSAMFILLLPGAYCWITSLILERIYRKYSTSEETRND